MSCVSHNEKRPRREGVGPRLLALAGPQKETPPGGGVGPEMRSPAGFTGTILLVCGGLVNSFCQHFRAEKGLTA